MKLLKNIRLLDVLSIGDSDLERAPTRWPTPMTSVAIVALCVIAIYVRLVGPSEPVFPPSVNVASAHAADEPICGPTKTDQVLMGSTLHLPIIDFLGNDDICETWISVQNVGQDDAKAALVAFGEPGFCPPQAAGPMKVTCTGLIRPGASWELAGSLIPHGTKSAVLYRFTARRLSEIEVDLGFDDVVADYMCELLFFAAIGDDDYWLRYLRPALYEGTVLGGIPLDRAAGDGVLAATVVRECPSATTPGNKVRSAYNAIPGTRIGTCASLAEGFRYAVPLVVAKQLDLSSILYVQNAGLLCAQVEIWFQDQGTCTRGEMCRIESLPPDEMMHVNASDCVRPGFQGSATIRSDRPLAIVTDIEGSESLMTYAAQPERLNTAFEPLTERERELNFPDGTALTAPIVYNGYEGWESSITVQAIDGERPTKARVAFFSENGDVQAVVNAWICPRGSKTFLPAMIADLPEDWRGAVRVEVARRAEDSTSLGHDPREARIAGVVYAWRQPDDVESGAGGGLAYSMRPESETIGWEAPDSRCGYNTVISAIPRLTSDSIIEPTTTDLAVLNLANPSGQTHFTVKRFDKNGVVDTACLSSWDGQVHFSDPNARSVVDSGFQGAAIVSASYWEHDRFDDRGNFVRTELGLVSAIVQRPTAVEPFSRLADAAIGVAGTTISSKFRRGAGRLKIAPDSGLDRYQKCYGPHSISFARPVCSRPR